MAKYAEGTKVSVESSRGEIMGLLAKHGVQRMAQGIEPAGDTIQFELNGQQYMLRITRPTIADIRRMYPNTYDQTKKLAAEWQRRWRATVLLLKAKLEFADGETSTVERELLPYMLLPDGRTTLEEAVTQQGLPQLVDGR